MLCENKVQGRALMMCVCIHVFEYMWGVCTHMCAHVCEWRPADDLHTCKARTLNHFISSRSLILSGCVLSRVTPWPGVQLGLQGSRIHLPVSASPGWHYKCPTLPSLVKFLSVCLMGLLFKCKLGIRLRSLCL